MKTLFIFALLARGGEGPDQCVQGFIASESKDAARKTMKDWHGYNMTVDHTSIVINLDEVTATELAELLKAQLPHYLEAMK